MFQASMRAIVPTIIGTLLASSILETCSRHAPCAGRKCIGRGSSNGTAFAQLERKVNGATKRYALDYGGNERLAPSVIKSICAHLCISFSDFNMHPN